jgi:ferrous iron transport protein A
MYKLLKPLPASICRSRGRQICQILDQDQPVLSILIIMRSSPELPKPESLVKRPRPRVRHLYREHDPPNPPPLQPPQNTLHQSPRRAFSEHLGIYRYRNQVGPIPAKAGDRISNHLSTADRDQEELPAVAGVFCKQFAIISIGSETGLLNFQDSRQVAFPFPAYFKTLFHSVILYFGALGIASVAMAKKKRVKKSRHLDKDFGQAHTETMLQLNGNKSQTEIPLSTLVDLRKGDAAILDHIELPHDDARRLMELGFLPGSRITAGFSAPGGDPRVFQVDGSEIALRRITARHLKVRRENPEKGTRKL